MLREPFGIRLELIFVDGGAVTVPTVPSHWRSCGQRSGALLTKHILRTEPQHTTEQHDNPHGKPSAPLRRSHPCSRRNKWNTSRSRLPWKTSPGSRSDRDCVPRKTLKFSPQEDNLQRYTEMLVGRQIGPARRK